MEPRGVQLSGQYVNVHDTCQSYREYADILFGQLLKSFLKI